MLVLKARSQWSGKNKEDFHLSCKHVDVLLWSGLSHQDREFSPPRVEISERYFFALLGYGNCMSDGNFRQWDKVSAPASSLTFLALADPVHANGMATPAQSFWYISVNIHDLHCLDIKRLAAVPCSMCWISNSSNCSPIQQDQCKTWFSYPNLMVRFLHRVWLFSGLFFFLCVCLSVHINY